MYYYFLVDGSISFFSVFPPFFSFVLKYLQYFLYSAGLELLPKISLGSTNVFGLAYISSYVLIINFFLLAFFWISVEPINFEASSEPIEEISFIKAIENDSLVYTPGEEKPFLIVYVEEVGIDNFYRRLETMKIPSSLAEIDAMEV